MDLYSSDLGGISEVMIAYLYTCPHFGGRGPYDHGQVTIDDAGFVNGETPVEDFGMFFYGPVRFEGDVHQAFYDLLFDRENAPKDYCGNVNHEYKPDWKLSDTPVGQYLKVTDPP